MNRETADRLHAVIMAGITPLDDKTASIAPEIYNPMRYNGELIKAGTRINWHGVLKRAAVALWDIEENNPDKSPNLWTNIAYHDGIRIIPNPITAEQVFAFDELGWQDGHTYRSKMHGNVFPVTQTDAWEMIE